jgi:hypothetical protein
VNMNEEELQQFVHSLSLILEDVLHEKINSTELVERELKFIEFNRCSDVDEIPYEEK